MKTELREKVIQLIGEYSASIMVTNPQWVFDPKPAIKLADSILEAMLLGE